MSLDRDIVLGRAGNLINGDRREAYGDAGDSFSSIAAYWTNYLHYPVVAKDVAAMMILLKVSRGMREDDLVDICGYAALASEL